MSSSQNIGISKLKNFHTFEEVNLSLIIRLGIKRIKELIRGIAPTSYGNRFHLSGTKRKDTEPMKAEIKEKENIS